MTPKPNEILEEIESFLVEKESGRGQQIIEEADVGHVYEVWEDGELTSTKGGDLFRKRSLHQLVPPVFPNQQLWEVPGDKNHLSRVVKPEKRDEVKDVLWEAKFPSTEEEENDG